MKTKVSVANIVASNWVFLRQYFLVVGLNHWKPKSRESLIRFIKCMVCTRFFRIDL